MPLYVVDTSSFINLERRYPRAVFPGVWIKVESLVDKGRLAAPWQVYHEMGQKHDLLFMWAKDNRQMFRKNTKDEEKFAAGLIREYPDMRPSRKAERADPYIVAMARFTSTLGGKSVIVTEESAKSRRIPAIARLYGLDHVDLVGMMLKEKWSFR